MSIMIDIDNLISYLLKCQNVNDCILFTRHLSKEPVIGRNILLLSEDGLMLMLMLWVVSQFLFNLLVDSIQLCLYDICVYDNIQ